MPCEVEQLLAPMKNVGGPERIQEGDDHGEVLGARVVDSQQFVHRRPFGEAGGVLVFLLLGDHIHGLDKFRDLPLRVPKLAEVSLELDGGFLRELE